MSLAQPGHSRLLTPLVPRIGDAILLYDTLHKVGGRFVVIDVEWLHASWGSADFPYDAEIPNVGPLVDVIVEPSPGRYEDEADPCGKDVDGDSCTAYVNHDGECRL